jgi:pyruvate-formate lyase
LTEDFYRALRNEGTKTYTTGGQDEYLRQIAVSTKFMVETNLRIIEQQARMIELLEKQATEK